SSVRGGGVTGATAATHQPAGHEQHDDRADDGTDDAAEVEHVVVTDPDDPEERVAEHRPDEAEHDGRHPGLPPFEVLERIVGDQGTSDGAGNDADDECTDHRSLPSRESDASRSSPSSRRGIRKGSHPWCAEG